MTAAYRRMAARRSSPCKLLIIVLHANREHRRDAYATLGSATCLTPRPPTFHVARHSTKLLSLTLSLVDFFGFLLADRPGDTSRSALKSPLKMSKLEGRAERVSASFRQCQFFAFSEIEFARTENRNFLHSPYSTRDPKVRQAGSQKPLPYIFQGEIARRE